MFNLFEYLFLRILRKYLFPGNLVNTLQSFLPYYKPNLGITNPFQIIKTYESVLHTIGLTFEKAEVLEIGIGSVNNTGYALATKNVNAYYGYEPYARFDLKRDNAFRQALLENHPDRSKDQMTKIVHRVTNLNNLENQKFDIIFSHSVLEHVNDLDALLQSLKKVLKDNGVMIHVVDYRDHFFKYPYHFLLLSKWMWQLISPGNLYRDRINDHIKIFENFGFKVMALNKETDEKSFLKIQNRIHDTFKHYDEGDLKTTKAILVATHE